MSVKYYCDFCGDEIEKNPITLMDENGTENFCDYGCLKLYCEEQ